MFLLELNWMQYLLFSHSFIFTCSICVIITRGGGLVIDFYLVYLVKIGSEPPIIRVACKTLCNNWKKSVTS